MQPIDSRFSISEIFKDAEKIQSFVIEELALRQLLQDAWRPVGRKLLGHLKGVIDFKNYTFSMPKGVNMELWLTDDMYDASLEKVWKRIAPKVKKYVSKAYQRGIDEEGNPPQVAAAKSAVSKSVSSVFAERKKQAIEILSNLAKMSFTGYAHEHAIPAIRQAIGGLGRLETLRKSLPDTQLDTDRQIAEIGRTEMLRKLRIAAIDNARLKLINSLRKQVGEYQHAGSTANLSISRAHHFGFLDWADKNGIEYYEVSAVLDDKTCPACFKMDGKVFRVRDALAYRDRFLAAAGDKAKLKEETPFLTGKTVGDVQGVDLRQVAQGVHLLPASSVSTRDFYLNRDESLVDSELTEKFGVSASGLRGAAYYDALEKQAVSRFKSLTQDDLDFMDDAELLRRFGRKTWDNPKMLSVHNDISPALNVRSGVQHLAQNLGLNDKPLVLPTQEFEEYVANTNATLLYRGVRAKNGLTAKVMQDFLKYGDKTWLGDGTFGDGLYFTTKEQTARGAYGSGVNGSVLRAVLNADRARVLNFYDQLGAMKRFARNDRTLYALKNGYNVIRIEMPGRKEDFLVVLDRGALVCEK